MDAPVLQLDPLQQNQMVLDLFNPLLKTLSDGVQKKITGLLLLGLIC